MLCSLALIPFEHVNDCFEKVLSTRPYIPNTEKFMDYFVGTYFEGSYDLTMWNHFNTKGTSRTNNNLEGYNYKLNTHLSIARSDIYKVISKFKIEEVDSSLKYIRALNNERPPPRKKLFIINDALLLNQNKMLLDNDITIDTFVKYTIQILDFSKLEKKLKDIDLDEASSDETESENSSSECDE
ncbi:unnamed protein product [Brachionus calyciflorus]|uniref:Uncharacterized protein n=1 Tax=Brachionus calyciflorus TaxID=104777 RepID=A0A813NA63_9BILA|nr:unnamed protein product [Brachionus calyciflorus]